MRPLLPTFIFLVALHSQVVSQRPTVDKEPEILHQPVFELSQEAIAAGIDGTLWIAVKIDKTGAVSRVDILAGPEWPCSSKPRKEIERVKESVMENLRQTKFSPAVKNGEPVEIDIGINFWIGRAYEELLRRREEASKSAGVAAPKTIKAGVMNGRAISLPKPEYPFEARSSRVSGTVTVSILIDEEGKVVSAGAKNGHHALQDASRKAACGARFSPTVLDGKPVKVSGVITYNFVAPR